MTRRVRQTLSDFQRNAPSYARAASAFFGTPVGMLTLFAVGYVLTATGKIWGIMQVDGRIHRAVPVLAPEWGAKAAPPYLRSSS